MKAAILVLAVISLVQADMYLHNPRGSNNRLDEANRERNNGNRLFDSQNNNRGGYNVGSVYYYEGSIVSIEWTNQHTCGDQNSHCEQILQIMCDDRLRDGASTQTIPENQLNCDNFDCNTDLEYGMHEDYQYYANCKLRERNMGLFTSDRRLRGNSARFTRQNENGNRRGYECPEERDYYPYWHPTPWRDIAVFTTDVSRCPYYQRESENVKSRFACIVPPQHVSARRSIPITQEDCEEIFYPDETGATNGTSGVWQEFDPDPRFGAPECVEAQWSRDNHLGNTVGGFPMYYNWTVPTGVAHEHCALRIRYNISTGDYDAWEAVDGRNESANFRVFNGDNDNLANRRISTISSVQDRFQMEFDEARERGYVFRQNPVVKVFPDSPSSTNNFGLQLAINTNQFGRTFQDRSHSFAIRELTDEVRALECRTMYNLNVRGKRGNIVQVYPGVEYDFVPNRLVAAVDDCIHIQWTGSNTNPNNNDGQGRAGTDRSNIILLAKPRYSEGSPKVETYGDWGTNYPSNLDSGLPFLGLSREDMQSLATLDNMQYGGEMSELDDAGTYFDLGPRKVTMRGTYYYMCSRNNNFTNRGQKGKLIIQDDPLALKRIGWTGGVVETPGTRIEFPQGALTQAIHFRVTDFANRTAAMQDLQGLAGSGISVNLPSNEASGYKRIDPPTPFEGAEGMGEVSINLDSGVDPNSVTILRASAATSWVFEPLDTSVVDGRAVAQTNQGGIFVASTPAQLGVVVGIPVAIVVVLLALILAVGLIVYFRVRPEKWNSTKENVQKTQMKIKRSFAKQI